MAEYLPSTSNPRCWKTCEGVQKKDRSGIVDALVPGGRLALVEYRGEDETLPLPPIHRLTEEQAIREMEFVGLEWVATKRDLPQQHLLVFQKPVL
jgi:hypothetical protein